MPNKVSHSYHVFETKMGFVAIGWKGDAITSLRLPAHTSTAAEKAVQRRLPTAFPAQPSGRIGEIVDAIKRYFAGERVMFDNVSVDLGAQEPFFSEIYRAVRKLGWGETITYGGLHGHLERAPRQRGMSAKRWRAILYRSSFLAIA